LLCETEFIRYQFTGLGLHVAIYQVDRVNLVYSLTQSHCALSRQLQSLLKWTKDQCRQSLDFTFNRFFKTSNMEIIVNYCQRLFGCDLPSTFIESETAFWKIYYYFV